MYNFRGHLGAGAYGDVYSVEGQDGLEALKIFKPTKSCSMYYQDLAREVFGLSQLGLLKGLAMNANEEFGVLMPEMGNPVSPPGIFKKYEPQECAAILWPIANTLSKLHGIHRDVKPPNILLPAKSGQDASLIDFSISTNMPSAFDKAVVTSWYRPPEVFVGFEYTNKIDIWSLGIVLLNLITGSQFCTTDTSTIMLESIFDHFGRDHWPEIQKLNPKYFESVSTYLDSIEEPARGLLKICLRTNPINRASWPEVLDHSFWSIRTIVPVSPCVPRNVKGAQTDFVKNFLIDSVVFVPTESYRTGPINESIEYIDILMCASNDLNLTIETIALTFCVFSSAISNGSINSIDSLIGALYLVASYNNDIRSNCITILSWEKYFNKKIVSRPVKAIRGLRHAIADVIACCGGRWPELDWPTWSQQFLDADPWMLPWLILLWKTKLGLPELCETLRSALRNSKLRSVKSV